MLIENYFLSLIQDYFEDEDEAFIMDYWDTNVYSNELCYKIYSGRFDIEPKLVDFNGQCSPEDSTRVFYNRGEDNLYYLVNWEQYANAL